MDTEPRSEAVPGLLLRLTAIGGALATGAVVASAVLELGTTHWGIALVALPLLVAVAIVVRLAYPTLFARALSAVGLFLLAIALGGVVAWSDSAAWADALHVGVAAFALARGPARRQRRLSRIADAARIGTRLPDADEASHHVAPSRHRRSGHVRRRAGSAGSRPLRRDDGRACARLRGSVGSEPRARPGHRRPHGQPDPRATRRVRPRLTGAGARIRTPPVCALVRAPRLGRESADGASSPSSATSSTSSSTRAG